MIRTKEKLKESTIFINQSRIKKGLFPNYDNMNIFFQSYDNFFYFISIKMSNVMSNIAVLSPISPTFAEIFRGHATHKFPRLYLKSDRYKNGVGIVPDVISSGRAYTNIFV